MKLFLILALISSLVLGLFGCGKGVPASGESTAAENTPTLLAGYGQGDISAMSGYPLAGGANSSERISTGYLSNLYSTAIALTDGKGNTALLVNVDAVMLKDETTNEIRQWVTETYGIPSENILLAAIHQHSTPDPYNAQLPEGMSYKQKLHKGIKESITAALDDRAPAQLLYTTVQTEAMSFVRNYWTNDNTIVGDNYGSAASGIKAHESDSDKEMRLIKFLREGSEDIILVNFQAHPHLGCSGEFRYDVHSDWPGVMRDEVSKELGCHVVYMSAASGNLNSNSRISTENVSKDFREHGHRAAQYVIGAEGTYTAAAPGELRCKEVVITCDADHSLDHLVPEASVVSSARSQGTEYAQQVMKDYPMIHSVFHATAIVNKANAPLTVDLPISVITLGDIAFTVHPYEMFDTNGMELRSGTVGNDAYTEQLENPYAMTMISTLTNGWNGYIPSQLGYTNGGYSTDITRFAEGSGEKLVTEYLQLLNELHGN